MLVLITGVPGAGKTQHMLRVVRDRALEEGRPVFYWNVRGLQPPSGWHGIAEPHEWMTTVPDGAIVVMDEVQDAFPPRPPGSKVPEAVAALATHRHRGLDIYVTCQAPLQTDVRLRDVAGEHWHVVRVHKKRYVVNVYNQVVNPKDWHDQQKKMAVQHHKYCGAIFKLYESTVLDTHKTRVPKKLLVIPLALIAIPALGWYALASLGPEDEAKAVSKKIEVSDPGGGFFGTGSVPGRVDRNVSQATWMQNWMPRVADVPFSAPVYDQLSEDPATMPKPHCVASARRCQCYTQQATRVSVSQTQCRHYARFGWFDPYREERRASESRSERRSAVDPASGIQDAGEEKGAGRSQRSGAPAPSEGLNGGVETATAVLDYGEPVGNGR